MKAKLMKACFAGIFGFAMASNVYADDLMQVYAQAVRSDPTFKQSTANWWATKQNMPIAVAAYLPDITATYNLSRIYGSNVPKSTTSDGWHTQNAFSIATTQPIFDFNAWMGIRQAGSQVKAATATYLSSIQDLMSRTATAYFDVLRAQSALIFTIANKRAVKRNLTTAEQQFKVGLIAITGVYDAQSRYNQAVANEIADRNEVYNTLEKLRAITGIHYSSLMGIKMQVPLVMPVPNNINSWVSTAEQKNYDIKAQEFTVEAARQNIKIQASPFLPTVDAQNTYNWAKNQDYGKRAAVASGANLKSISDTWGLEVGWTSFNPVGSYYSTKQARYQYLSAVGQLEFTHRDVVSTARQSFLGIVSQISKIKADYLTIVSYRSSQKATEAGYQVGTRTMVDVLNSIADVYRSENVYMNDQYDYMKNIITLKEAAGTLKVQDLQQLNSWMKKKYKFSLPAKYYPNLNTSQASYDSIKRSSKQPPSAPTPPVSRQSLSFKAPYTIQFFASNNLKAAESFKAHSKIGKDMKILHLGKTYKVVYGQYKQRSNALVALDSLPIDHTKNHAWVERLPQQKVGKHFFLKKHLAQKEKVTPSKPVYTATKPKPAQVHYFSVSSPIHHAVQLPYPARS